MTVGKKMRIECVNQELDKKILKLIKNLCRWVFWRHLADKIIRCVPVGVLGGGVLELIAYFNPWYNVHFWAAGVIVISLAVAFIWSLVTRPGIREAALALDATGLKERTVTAWELLGDDSFFAGMQKKDAWEHLSQVAVRKRLPLTISWKRPAFLAAAAVFFLVSAVAPSPAKEVAASQHLVAEKAEEEEGKIEEVMEELEEDFAQEELTSREYEEYKELLEQLKEELSEAETQDNLDKALERAEYKLSEVAENTENKTVQERMQQLSASLGGDKKENTDDGQDTMQAAADMQQLSEEAERLLDKLEESGDLSELSEEELEALKEALEQLAQAAGDSDMAEQLQNAASQISSGSLSASQLASAQASVSALKQQAQTVLAQSQTNANQSSGGNSNENNNSGNGNGDGSGNGNGNGNGSGSGSGNGNGSGSGSGNGNGSGNGSGSGGSGSGWNYGGKNGKEQETTYNGEMVAVPNGVGEDENLTGSAGQGASYSSQGGPSLTWSGNSVALDQVIGSYSDQAMSKIQGANYPSGVQDIVKSYFEQLNQ